MQKVMSFLKKNNEELVNTSLIKWLSNNSPQRSFEIFEDKIAFIPALIPFFMGVRDIVDSLEVNNSKNQINSYLLSFQSEFNLDEERLFEEFSSLGFHPSKKDREFSYNYGRYWKTENKAQRLFNLKTYSYSQNTRNESLIILFVIEEIYNIIKTALDYEINTDDFLSIHWPIKIQKDELIANIKLPASSIERNSSIINEIYGLANQCFESWYERRSEFKRSLLLTRKFPNTSQLNNQNHIQ